MNKRRKYLKKVNSTVIAVQLDLVTEGFVYQKWGGEQRCQSGDWIVNNQGDTYTVSRASFADTYERVSPGEYKKVAPVWAERATKAGKIVTKEGETRYAAGDYLVYNKEDGSDSYAVSKDKFESLYAPLD